MSDDIVTRLRSHIVGVPGDKTDATLGDAAAEIRRLREELYSQIRARDYWKSNYDEIQVERHALRERLAEAERDAALGRIALRFVDRAGDYCDIDPAERICDEFNAVMAAEVDRQRRESGLYDAARGES